MLIAGAPLPPADSACWLSSAAMGYRSPAPVNPGYAPDCDGMTRNRMETCKPRIGKALAKRDTLARAHSSRRKHHALQAHLRRLPSRYALDAADAVCRERPARPQGAHAVCRGRAGRATMGLQE